MIRPPNADFPTDKPVPPWRIGVWLLAAIPLLVVFVISGLWQGIETLTERKL